MKSNVLIGLLTFIWLVLMANIIWMGTDSKWLIEDVEKISQLEVSQYTNQLVMVAVSDEVVRLYLYEKNFADGELWDDTTQESEVTKVETMKWQLVLETEALIGRNGLGKTKEGDGKTPIGVFLFTKAFGILENPGTKMTYTQVSESHYWVDDSNSRYYNQFVNIDEAVPDWKTAEHILEFGECYNYVLATSFNAEGISGAGSAVFLHCVSKDMKATAGCVAIPEVFMRELIKRVEPTCVLIIDEADKILSY